jgi:transcriptional regulator with XRE-family HTH domain
MTYAESLAADLVRIRRILARTGMSQSELARRAGLTQAHVCNVLAGVRGFDASRG